MNDYDPNPAARARMQARAEYIEKLVQERNPRFGAIEALWDINDLEEFPVTLLRPLIKDKERFGADTGEK